MSGGFYNAEPGGAFACRWRAGGGSLAVRRMADRALAAGGTGHVPLCHSDVSSRTIDTHVLSRSPTGVASPVDRLPRK